MAGDVEKEDLSDGVMEADVEGETADKIVESSAVVPHGEDLAVPRGGVQS